MKPELLVKSDDNAILNSIVSCLTGVECSKFFAHHLGKQQADQKRIVGGFQEHALSVLAGAMRNLKWSKEHSPSSKVRDSIDIYGKGKDFVVAIELDKNRADQVAKKYVSRMAILSSPKIYFLSLCYPGTEKMNKAECAKYFGYCSILTRRMGHHYAGLIIEHKI